MPTQFPVKTYASSSAPIPTGSSAVSYQNGNLSYQDGNSWSNLTTISGSIQKTVAGNNFLTASTGVTLNYNSSNQWEITGSRWQTVLDVDFSAQPNQTLSSDTTYTIGGYTFTKINSTNDATAMAVVSGSGLVITPKEGNPGSNVYNSARSLPAVLFPLVSSSFNLSMDTPLRITLLFGNDNLNTSILYQGTTLSLESISASSRDGFLIGRYTHSFNGNNIYSYCNYTIYGSTIQLGTINVNNQALRLVVPSGIAQQEISYMSAPYTYGGTPPKDNAYKAETASGPSFSQLLNNRTISGWSVLIGAINASPGASGFSTTIVRLIIEAIL